MNTPKEIAEAAVRALDGKNAHDLRLLRTTDVTVLADYFVICTAASTTQIKTLADAAEAALEAMGETKLHREGYRSGSWVLLDFGCVVIHLFMEEARQFYNLERLWADAEEIDITHLVEPDGSVK
ncbi:MAG: ribosome silencing factor [Oscillospiraceae bacterium]|nr:ribosome silencing factor [Oscillospiraceae bacterium]